MFSKIKNRIKNKIKNTGANIVYDGIDRYNRVNILSNIQKDASASNRVQILFECDDVDKNLLFPKKHSPVISDSKKDYYINNYGMHDYMISFFNDITSCIDLSGKRVLEIGGSHHPVELAIGDSGAKKWVCVDKPWIYNSQSDDTHFKNIPVLKLGDVALDSALKDNDYILFNNYGEDITDDFYDKFDVCISICSFEHIKLLPIVLDKIYNSLKKGGILYSVFAPIWSSVEGNHLWIEEEGVKITHGAGFGYPEELRLVHLTKGYAETYELLEKRFGVEAAKKHVFNFRNPDFTNNLFYEDYIYLMHKTAFGRKSVSPLYFHNIIQQDMILLQNLYPGYNAFDVGGVVIQAVK